MTNVLFTASESTPFVKTGGLADVIGSLPKALKQQGHADVRVILPKYDHFPEPFASSLVKKTSFTVNVGWREHIAELFEYEHDGITYYFISNDYYFGRNNVYGYFDDGERYVYFCRAVIDALPYLDFTPDVLHAHDWQTGLAVAFANILQPIEGMRTVFTIHNIQYQGWLMYEAFDDLFNLPRDHFAGFEWKGMLNCMKSGIFHADKITTVSPSYAQEIMDPYFGEGLDPLLRERHLDVAGVINGIDTDSYNPQNDPNIPVQYKHSREKKRQNKEIIQEELGLPVRGDVPLYIAISRFVEQKGFHLLERILPEFLQQDVQVVLLGTGDYEFESSFSWIAHMHHERMATVLTFDEKLARRLYAASDFFIMPSKFEPCGLSQLIALMYKSVPIVRETGGLKDTVIPFNQYTGTGNGFSFQNYNAHELLQSLQYSLSVFHDPLQWKALMKNVNKSSFSWKDSAAAYADIYKELTAGAIKESD
ncbi:glycogen synthase GlgA [Salisediminibacterium halotolerans]|uniref:glycogen synthase GlgA n=1 Tax=Salisediminibacterium halotolerans TaxID=517425 RepID=UPI000EB0E246|nr:glycogen synthase GlgA [Salisediminibacterium halotolerans]RLJ69412.1 starch synthase [Actinophytocola xinjiangensis]RPE83962.1 starch synthase [Salisediminibacterium halotolerans]TWG32487.1 starch synthase [Salisediminibacterium halotolerans]GEL07672.1 glycogen synthase [Salisediminibacterium halotolerans]